MKKSYKIAMSVAVTATSLVLLFQNVGIIRSLPPVPAEEIPLDDARILSRLKSDSMLQPIADIVSLEEESQALASTPASLNYTHTCNMLIVGVNQNRGVLKSLSQLTPILFSRGAFGTSLYDCVVNLNAAGALGSICHNQYVRPNAYFSGSSSPISSNVRRPGDDLQYLVQTYGYTMAIPQNGSIYITSRSLSSNVTQGHPPYNYSCAYH